MRYKEQGCRTYFVGVLYIIDGDRNQIIITMTLRARVGLFILSFDCEWMESFVEKR
jgi:hypothetical protein